MIADTDIAILGAGCAGLSLAAALTQARVPGHVLLLEPRTTYTRDRTWCFWNTEEHPFTSAISHSWRSWRVSQGTAAAVQRSRRYQYCHIAGDAFYRSAIDLVERAPEQELCRGITVHSVERQPNGLMAVETSNGRLLAKRVFDSRPQTPSVKSGAVLLQRFLGWHIQAADPCFDQATVELMRFLPADAPGRLRFLYLLPFSPTEALVEMTYLDDPALPEPEYKRDLEAWLAEQVGEYTVLYTEHGRLPMGDTAARVPTERGITPIGTRGGRVKPSSGYAFLRIQRHSLAMAEALRNGRPVPAGAEPRLYGAMDAVFLRALQRAPTSAPALFLRMFAGSAPDALVRFLGEASAPVEMLRVALSLPKLPLLRAGFEAAARAARGRPTDEHLAGVSA